MILKAKTPGRKKLESWLSKNMKIEMTDGRTLIGIFLCTDQGMNIILGSCSEYLKPDGKNITHLMPLQCSLQLSFKYL